MKFEATKSIKFTAHAAQRARESGVTTDQMQQMLVESYREKPPKTKNKNYKMEKYGADQQFTSYWRNGLFIFTVIDKPNCHLIVTCINQEIMLPNFPKGGFHASH